MRNAMTVDLEDWYHSEVEPGLWPGLMHRIQEPIERLLDLFDRHQVRATFFVLGHVAEKDPDVVREIARRGHEIAAHGHIHQFAYRQSEQEFSDDIRSVKERLERTVGAPVIGYRAPFFSITRKSGWALRILSASGYRYDSSIFPVINHRYGIPDACRIPHRIDLDNGSSIMEFPLTTMRRLGQNLPVCGGVYFRFLPYGIIRRGFREHNAGGIPGVFYLHVWELDPGQPKLTLAPFLYVRRYFNLHGVEEKLKRLLTDFRFCTLRELYESYNGDGPPGGAGAWTGA